MKIVKETIDAFYVAGIGKRVNDASECSKLWDELYSKYSHETLSALGRGYPFGLCRNWAEDESFEYFAVYDCAKEQEPSDLEKIAIEKAEYVRVEVVGAVPQSIRQSWAFLMEDYFPQHNLSHAGTPDFEVYYPGDIKSENYKMELWVPVKTVH